MKKIIGILIVTVMIFFGVNPAGACILESDLHSYYALNGGKLYGEVMFDVSLDSSEEEMDFVLTHNNPHLAEGNILQLELTAKQIPGGELYLFADEVSGISGLIMTQPESESFLVLIDNEATINKHFPDGVYEFRETKRKG